MSEITIEWAPFTLADGATEEQLLAASAELQSEFLAVQDGFIRRELLKGEGRGWCDLVYWRDLEAARKAGEEVAESPVCHRYFALMVAADTADPEAGVQHFSLRETYLESFRAREGESAGSPSAAPAVR